MIFRRIALSAVAVMTLASCGIVPSANDAFSVGDTSWSREKFNTFLTELINVQQIASFGGGANGEDARGVATVLIRQEATNAFLASQGESITDADREALLANVTPEDPFNSYSELLQNTLLQINASSTALARVKMPTTDALKALYNTLPARAGVLCLSHIVVETREDAMKALRRVNNGEDFATVARDVSIEPAALQTGGGAPRLRIWRNGRDRVACRSYPSGLTQGFSYRKGVMPAETPLADEMTRAVHEMMCHPRPE